MALRTLILILLCLARPAAAEPDPRWQRGYTYAGGVEELGNLVFAQIGLEIHASVRASPRLRIAGSGDLLNTNRDRPDGLLEGETLRASGGVEWDVYGPRDVGFTARVAAVGGIGDELTMWPHGLVSRPLAYAGVEGSEGFAIEPGAFFHGIRSLAFRAGVRVTAAPAIPTETLALRCAGPCAPRSADGPLDLGAMFYFGLDFGR